jgi:hypothetical protein
MTSYSYTVTFSDIQVIDLTNMINEKIKAFEEKHGDSLPVPYWWIDILDKLGNARTGLRSHTSFDEDGKPTIIIKT